MFLSRLIAVLALALPMAAHGHEFWIEPERYHLEAGERLQAKFKNGENFKGSTLSFFDRNSARFEMRAGGETIALTPRAGDSPALDVDAPTKDGLVVVVHETTPSFVTYREWAKFLKFAKHKDFKAAAKDHLSAGWPKEMFRERYTRHAKALFAVGTGEGTDQPMGLKTEIVALTNPYAEDFNDDMKVRVLLDGAPRADAQVEVFDRAPDDSVVVTLHRTNADGVASIPVSQGHAYLFDAVVLRPAQDAMTDNLPVLWETYWAALTFSVPR